MTNPYDTASVAAAYTLRGWAVIPIRAGAKLPLERDWPNQGRRTAAEVAAAWQLYPDANVGIVTGRVSGLWVLDIDPGNGGMVALAGLVQAYGKLPETYVVRTPSGGLHYYFLLPPDFEPRNAQHGRVAGRLPVGIDVRGRGGQVVAPPSVRPDGAYTLVADFPLSPAPEWLLDMIRPLEPPERPAPPDSEMGVSGQLSGLRVGTFWDGWLRRTITEELARLAGAVEGQRDDVAFGVAIRLVEIANSAWNELEPDALLPHFLQAAAICSANGAAPFTEAEALTKWRNALTRRGGVGVPPPADLGLAGTRVEWTPPSDFDRAGQDPANPFSSPGGSGASTQVAAPLINGPSEQGVALDPFEIEVRRALGQLLVRREAERRLRVRDAIATDFDQVAMDDAGLAELPEAPVLVAGWLSADALARINGPSGHGKSFVVLDLGACVSTGIPWHGHAVTRAKVCYVVAEGARGMATRAAAWCERHGLDSTGITFVPRPVQVAGPEWAIFKDWCARNAFGLIIFDTQARGTVGVDENDATEMGEVIAALDELKVATGACTMLVHHRGLRGDQGRGSTAVRGALDTELDVSRQGTTLTLKSTKQKDGADPDPIRFTMNPLGASVVLVGERDAIVPGSPFTSPMVAVSLRERCAVAIAHALIDASGSGLTRAEAQTHARVALGLPGDESTRRTVRRAWADLIGLGRIAKAQGREAHFFIDLEGAPIMQANQDKAVSGGPEVYLG